MDSWRIESHALCQQRDRVHRLWLQRQTGTRQPPLLGFRLSFQQFFEAPRVAAAYNVGSGSLSDCSVLEPIELSKLITDREMRCFPPENREKNHVWYISDWSKSSSLDPKRTVSYTVCAVLREIFEQNAERRRCQMAAVA
jgi:hypothetical protein